MPPIDYRKLRDLAALSADDIGPSEEDVKVNFAVPLLEALGHTRLRFEHRQRDIVLRTGLARGTTVVVETKRYGEPLDRHLGQLEGYAAQERCLIAVLTNGDEVRAYVPLWTRAPSFAHTLLLGVRRADLGAAVAARRLARLLGADALSTGVADRDIRSRQARLEQAWKHLAAVRTQARRQREGLEARVCDLQGQAQKLDADKRRAEGQLARLDAALERSLDTLRTLYRVRETTAPPPREAPFVATRGPRVETPLKPTNEPSVATASGGKPGRRRGRGHGWSKTLHWTDAELTTNSTDYQRRALATFVRAGKRTLGLYQIADATGIAPHKVWGAIRGFTIPVRSGRKEPLFEVVVPPRTDYDRTGNIVTVVEKYWPVLCRLYPEATTAPSNGPSAPGPASAVAKRREHRDRGHGWSKTLHWTDAELTTQSTDNQHRVLGAFVRAGQRTLGLLEIAASAGLRSQQAWGALTGFITPVRVGRKEPLLQVTTPERIELERRGVLITIVEKYWPILCRLYAEAAEKKSLDRG